MYQVFILSIFFKQITTLFIAQMSILLMSVKQFSCSCEETLRDASGWRKKSREALRHGLYPRFLSSFALLAFFRVTQKRKNSKYIYFTNLQNALPKLRVPSFHPADATCGSHVNLINYLGAVFVANFSFFVENSYTVNNRSVSSFQDNGKSKKKNPEE